MDIKEKQILVVIISTILIFTCYSLYVYNNYIVKNFEILNDFKFWGKTFLILIPVTIVSQIVIHIIFAIVNKIVTNEDIESKSDERDKIIDLKAIRVSHWLMTAGFVVAMITQVLGMQPYMLMLSLICFGFISAIVSELTKMYLYRKGF